MEIRYALIGVYLLASIQGFFLFCGLMRSGRISNRANRYLAVLVILITLFIARRIFHLSGLAQTSPFLIGFFYPLVYAFGPLLYFYTRELSSAVLGSPGGTALHFLPMLSAIVVSSPITLSMEKKQHFAEIVLIDPTYDVKTSELLPLLWVSSGWLYFAVYCLLVIGVQMQYRRAIGDEFSSLDQKTLYCLRFLAGLGAVTGLTGFIVSWGSLFQGYPLTNDTARYIDLLFIFQMYFLGYMGFAQPAIFSPATNHKSVPEFTQPAVNEAETPASQKRCSSEPQNQVKYQKSSLTPGAAEIYESQLLQAMSEQQLFLDNNLTLTSLANQLSIPHHHLSQIINESQGVNFFKFVNKYRIEYAKELLLAPHGRHRTVLDVAMASGFNNKTSFYKAFSSATGSTPSSYRKRQGV